MLMNAIVPASRMAPLESLTGGERVSDSALSLRFRFASTAELRRLELEVEVEATRTTLACDGCAFIGVRLPLRSDAGLAFAPSSRRSRGNTGATGRGRGSAMEKRATVWLPTESTTSWRPRVVTRRSRARVRSSDSENALRRLLIADDIL